jgi:hypothetical protein
MTSPLFLTPLIRLFGQTVNATENVSVSAVAVLKASPGLPLAIEQARCGQPNPQKLIQAGNPKDDNSGYTTYSVQNASATQIRALLKRARTCGIPAMAAGSPIQLNNGAIPAVYSDFQNVFQANPGKCYLIPVVRTGSKWNQSEKIVDFAKFCPDPNQPVVQNGNEKYIQGNVTCGQNPYNATGLSCYAPTLVRDVKSGM